MKTSKRAGRGWVLRNLHPSRLFVKLLILSQLFLLGSIVTSVLQYTHIQWLQDYNGIFSDGYHWRLSKQENEIEELKKELREAKLELELAKREQLEQQENHDDGVGLDR
jgi:hypothetical protein